MRALLVILVCLAMLTLQVSDSWAAASYNGKVNNAIAGVVQQKAVQQGFAANDNRVAGTMAAIGSGLGTFATTVAGSAIYGAVAGTAIPWLPVLAAAAGVALLTVAITAGYYWLFSSNTSPNGSNVAGATVTPGGSAVPTTPTNYMYKKLTAGSGYWSGMNGAFFNSQAGDPTTVLQLYFDLLNAVNGYPNAQYGIVGYKVDHCTVNPGNNPPNTVTAQCWGGLYYSQGYWEHNPQQTTPPVYGTLYFNQSGETLTCADGQGAIAESGSPSGWVSQPLTCTSPSSTYGVPGGTSNTAQSMTSADANVPTSVLSQPVDPGLLANAINQQWQQAASLPGYQGLPYQASNPVTSADVSAWQNANPNAYPTVGDALAPISPGSVGTTVNPVSVPDPSVSPGTSPTTNPGTQPSSDPNQINLGKDPGIGSPSLEDIPTAQQILQPILRLFPGIKSFAMPGHSGACPTGSFPAFGKTFTLEAHCTLLNQNAAAIGAGFVVFWTMAALFIILAA